MSARDPDRSHIRLAAIAVSLIPLAYILLWCAMFIGELSGIWHPRLGDFDIGTAIQRSDTFERAGLVVMLAGWLGGIVLCLKKQRIGRFALVLGALAHIFVWLRITDGQYYSGQFGIIMILLEMIAITLWQLALPRARRIL
ncbi:hypothetical protein [uncultured Maricaulis sp.]|uniref:hypothetical protein n=1 Tax=uncultured Maricaulis sp. TaxID=174710 RepID=UPI0025DB9DBE|nr:hypothetical protein [uncultured Maricaulis sp.]